MTRREVTFAEVAAWLQGKTVISENGSETFTILLNDGSRIIGEQQCNGPYSEVTPDLDWSPPKWFIETQ